MTLPCGELLFWFFGEKSKNPDFRQKGEKGDFYENRLMRDFQGFEVSAKKKFCKKFWPRPKIPFFKLGGLRSLANSRLRGTVFPRRQPKISTFWRNFRHPRIWINNTGSLYRSSQEAFSIIIPLRKKNFRAKTVSVNLQKSTAVKL